MRYPDTGVTVRSIGAVSLKLERETMSEANKLDLPEGLTPDMVREAIGLIEEWDIGESAVPLVVELFKMLRHSDQNSEDS